MNRNLPHDLEIEKSLLGSILIDPESFVKVADKLHESDFFEVNHQKIYQAILQLYEKNQAIDTLTLANVLKNNKNIDLVGGPAYLAELTNYVPSASHIEEYADIVIQKSFRRKLIQVSSEISEISNNENQDLSDLIEETETKIFNISQNHVDQNIVSLETILAESFDRLDNLHKDKNKIRGVPTGYKDLDNKLAGFQKSDLIILAARPSMGKTALALNLAHNIAIKTKEPVLIFSLEMSKEQLVDRILAMESGVSAWALRTGNLTDKDFEKIGNAMGVLSETPIFIDDSPGITISELRTKARREAHKKNLSLIIVDYLQLMSGGNRYSNSSNRVQEVSEISRSLKIVARELNVPILALSQLSRSVENRSPQIPQLADLRESGSIEQDADVVTFIYREEYYNPETTRKNITDILIQKHRNGPTGKVELFFDTEKQKFLSIDKKHEDPFK